MNMLDLVKSRRSVRTFDGHSLSREHAEMIMAYAKDAENPYDLPITWRILSAKKHGLSSPVIVGTDAYIAGKMRRVPHAEEAFGFSFEKIVLYAQSLGVGTTWIAGTMKRSAFEKAMGLEEDEVMPCISPLGYPAASMSVREGLMRKGVKADSRFSFSDLFFDGSFYKPLTENSAGEFSQVFEMIRWAPSAVNKQPWRVVMNGNEFYFYEKKTRGYVNDGWDLQKIDMGIALCHFACGAEEKGMKCHLKIKDPGLSVPENTEYIATYCID